MAIQNLNLFSVYLKKREILLSRQPGGAGPEGRTGISGKRLAG
jgi:hypothetical protein